MLFSFKLAWSSNNTNFIIVWNFYFYNLLYIAHLWFFDALINDENKGWGAKGLDLNSGWNWTPINHGWFFNSIISGNLLSGDKPEKINPFFSNFSLNYY